MQRYSSRTSPLPSPRLHRRAGLAPLELTLSLPIMLFVMGLIVIVGSTAAWKARTVTNARHAVWRSTWPRNGAADPFPIGWPTAASMLVTASPSDALPTDPYAQHIAMRGPVLTAPTGESIPVRESLLDIHGDLTLGVADIERRFPLLANMGPGQAHLRREHALIERTWAFHEMGIRNVDRRIHVLYPIDLRGMIPAETARWSNAVTSILTNPNLEILRVLDDDPEMRQHAPPVGAPVYEAPYGNGNSPDYHFPERRPRNELLNPQRVCSYDPDVIREQVRDPLIPEIHGHQRRRSLSDCGVPGRLTRDHLRAYRNHLQHIEIILRNLDMNAYPPQIAAELNAKRGEMEANRTVLTRFIAQLEAFEQLLLSGG